MTFEMDHDGHTIEIDHDRDWGMEILGIKCPYKEQLKIIQKYFEERERGDIEVYWVWKDLKKLVSEFTTKGDNE